jgi:hypothetical protein
MKAARPALAEAAAQALAYHPVPRDAGCND